LSPKEKKYVTGQKGQEKNSMLDGIKEEKKKKVQKKKKLMLTKCMLDAA
jgi:hypothetical protein